MDTIGMRLKEARRNKQMTLDEVAKIVGVSRATIQRYESGTIANIPPDKLSILAQIFGTNIDYLINGTKLNNMADNIKLNARDERDIKRKLDEAIASLDSKEALMFDGEPLEMDDDTKDLLRASLENSIRLAKTLAKKKYTPKKYRKNSDN